MKEECGIAGIYLKKGKEELVPETLYSMLFQLQHRGQLSAGISVCDMNEGSKRIKILKEIGRVNNLFKVNNREENKKIKEYFKGVAGIGHVRYSTSGKAKEYLSLLGETQPFFRWHGRAWKRFSIAFNGNLANYPELRKEILVGGYILDTDVDTELMMHLFSLELKEYSLDKFERKPDFYEVCRKVMERLDGAYNILLLFADGDLIAIRDPKGIKPLVWGENDYCFAVASESVALEKIGIEKFYSVLPGSCVIFNEHGFRQKRLIYERKAHCHFEWTYFAKAGSVIDGRPVNVVRTNYGRRLAESEPLQEEIKKNPEKFVVIPVPNTSIPAAEEYADYFRIPCRSAIIKIRGDRGFINKDSEREAIMNREYVVLSDIVKDKKVLLIDDSLVRGETILKIIKPLRKAGAFEIHFRSTEPPITCPCFYGIDFPTPEELIANKFSREGFEMKVAEFIGADSVAFQNIQGLVDSIGFRKDELCLACLTGEYPTIYGEKRARENRFLN
jgi:amidophosphoribosyltransferase